MYKGTSDRNGLYEFEEQQYPAGGYIVSKPVNAASCVESPISAVEDAIIYGSDEFRMYAYKVKRCPRTRSHDWTECPYAHRGEKATRRDPRRHGYCAVACPAYRHGSCHRGDACDFAHGVFEYWLHPARYRTRVCNAGQFCQRKVCFFAHSPDQLRQPSEPATSRLNHRSRFAYRPVAVAPSSGGGGDAESGGSKWRSPGVRGEREVLLGGEKVVVRELWKSFHGMSIFEDNNNDTSALDLSHVDWISDLLD